MPTFRHAIAMTLSLFSAAASADVSITGPVEYGLFQSQYAQYQPGERLLTQNSQSIEPASVIPAKLGSRFGLRYTLQGKQASEQPLTLIYLTPGVITPDGKRHDKIVVEQPLALDAAHDIMAFEFSENYEVVPGVWQFMVFQGDRLLTQHSFEVR